ncbi:serine/arginine repetitive matrix protein 1 [Quillaja saponaria]|uniref:Serine/arginine repetitive matrix protein 1 n=1 Tax=Quillaja saponaria TaxID=32244 RepID=A0AAD7LJD5_QUISA|nr:serine/arginine repetitive matrix protein 1 [Quillaja saponaria]
MALDDSFRKPGTVPFKWEVKPGVPKVEEQSDILHPRRSSSQKLRPPPAPTGSNYFTPTEPRTPSLRLNSRARADRLPFGLPITRPDPVSVSPDAGCFISPFIRLLLNKKLQRRIPETKPEPDYTSDLETLSRWSASSRKSFSPFSDASSSSSRHSSPRPVNDADWAGFGLF